MMNYDKLNPSKYGRGLIQKVSKIKKRQFNSVNPTFAMGKISIDLIEDETSIINAGQYLERKYMHYQIQENSLSSWTHYPFQYKFMSIEFDLNMDIEYTDRTSYDLLNWMGDVGGVFETLFVACNVLAYFFSIFKIKAIVTNRLYRLSSENQKSIFGPIQLSDNQLKDYFLSKSATGETLISVPHNLLWE